MKKYEGFKSEASGKKYPMLPAGAYVAGIRNVKIDGQEPDQQLVLRLDIIEGEYAGYYTKRYEHDSQGAGFDQQYQAKYKGDLRIQIPNPDNTMRNHPEWDENKLKGKTVGINVREGMFNGNPYTQIGRLEVVNDVRLGLVAPMKPKKPSGQAVTGEDEQSGFTSVETSDLPF